MAVGFENGSVMLFKGDVTRDRYESTIQILILKSVGSLICCGFYVYTDVSKKKIKIGNGREFLEPCVLT